MAVRRDSDDARDQPSGSKPDSEVARVRAEIVRRIQHIPTTPSTNLPAVRRPPVTQQEEIPAIQPRLPRKRSMLSAFFVLLLVLTVVTAGVIGYGVLTHWPHAKNPVAEQTIDRSQPPLLKSIQDLSRYVAAEGSFQQVIDLQHDRKYVPNFLVNDRTLFVAAATVEVYIDFGMVGEGAIKASADRKTVEIDLPAPTMAKPNIDHAKSYVVAEQKGALNRLSDVFGSDPNKEQEVYVKAEQEIGAAAITSGLADHAQVNTRNMLAGMLHSLGYANVTINFATS